MNPIVLFTSVQSSRLEYFLIVLVKLNKRDKWFRPPPIPLTLKHNIVLFTSVVQGKRNGWWPKPLISFVRVYINKPEQ